MAHETAMPHPIPAHTKESFQRTLLSWYRRHRRNLPWRTSRDPYRIWIAEVMLQQTRIVAVLPYYKKFLEQFPSVRQLALAPEQEVLRAWSGLGYYSRARHLRAAAQEIVSRHKGQFPSAPEAARELPGIGRYTAAAVLSIAYDVPLAVLDGNVARVLARLGAIRGDLRVPRVWRRLGIAAENLLAARSPGDWNEALMELGEVICTPARPRCEVCPVSRWCRAFALGIAGKIPAPRRKHPAQKVRVAAALLLDPRGRTLLLRDPAAQDGALFSRMWQFPAVEVARRPRTELAAYLQSVFGLHGTRIELRELPAARHGVTFREIQLLPYLVRVPRLPRRRHARAMVVRRILDLPISSATRKIAAAAGWMPDR